MELNTLGDLTPLVGLEQAALDLMFDTAALSSQKAPPRARAPTHGSSPTMENMVSRGNWFSSKRMRVNPSRVASASAFSTSSPKRESTSSKAGASSRARWLICFSLRRLSALSAPSRVRMWSALSSSGDCQGASSRAASFSFFMVRPVIGRSCIRQFDAR